MEIIYKVRYLKEKRKFTKIFYQILKEADYCPEKAQDIITEKYHASPSAMFYFFKLLDRWNEWQKLEKMGGRNNYNLWKWMEENR